MQIQKQKIISKNNQGFTLIELLLVISIIAILASAILVGISGQRDKARASKVLVELSSTLQPMVMCWSDGHTVLAPPVAGGGNICNGYAVYGTWPSISSEDAWTFTTRSINNTNHSYTLTATKNGGGRSITCNSTTKSCKEN